MYICVRGIKSFCSASLLVLGRGTWTFRSSARHPSMTCQCPPSVLYSASPVDRPRTQENMSWSWNMSLMLGKTTRCWPLTQSDSCRELLHFLALSASHARNRLPCLSWYLCTDMHCLQLLSSLMVQCSMSVCYCWSLDSLHSCCWVAPYKALYCGECVWQKFHH